MTTKEKLRFKGLGPTGEFPEGKIDPTDEGALKMAVSSIPGSVRIDFGKRIAWFAVPPTMARQLAQLLLNHANRAEPQ